MAERKVDKFLDLKLRSYYYYNYYYSLALRGPNFICLPSSFYILNKITQFIFLILG